MPRVVGVASAGLAGASARLALDLAVAIAATGRRVAIGALDGRRVSSADLLDLTTLSFPGGRSDDVLERDRVREVIETQGRGLDRIVLDLGASTAHTATTFGPALDAIVLVVDATPAGATSAAAFATHLGRSGMDDDVSLLLVGRATEARDTIRAIGDAANVAAPRLVVAGIVAAIPSLQAEPIVSASEEAVHLADVIASVATRLVMPRPASLRGGLQFFVEDRIAQGRGGE